MPQGWTEDRGGRRRGVVQRDDGTRITKLHRNETDAKKWVRATIVDLQRGVVIPKRSGVTFGQLVDAFNEHSIDVRATTAARNKSLLKSKAAPLGPLRVAEITPQRIQSWVTSMSRDGAAPATVSKAHELVRRVMRDAVTAGYVPANPCTDTRLPRPRDPEPVYLTPTELSWLAAAIGARYRALMLVAGYGGLRIGEACALRLNDVDFDSNTVNVRQTLSDVGGHVTIGATKTLAGRRRVPLPLFVIGELEMHVWRYGPIVPSGFLFADTANGPLRPNNFRRRSFKPAVAASGVDSRLRIHDLRHTAASIWIAAGVQQKELSTRLGHASIRMTDIYGHLYPEGDAPFSDRVGALYVPPELPKRPA